MGKFVPTDRQREAITSVERSLCVRAGAGTGKTSVLVGRYVELLDRRLASVGEIAALTYTEKAAKVMKDRIREACADRERKSRDATQKTWWRRQRIELETAHISTLHGFCSRLLAEHPVDAGVDPSFTVLDEMEATLLVERAIDDAVKHHLEGEVDDVLKLCRELSLPTVRGMVARMMRGRDEAGEAVRRITSHSDEELVETWGRLLVGAQSEYVASTVGALAREGTLDALAATRYVDGDDRFAPRRDEAERLIDEVGKTNDAGRRVELAGELRDVVSDLRGGSKTKWSGDGLKTVKEVFRGLAKALERVPGGDFGREIGGVDRRALALTRALIRLYEDACEAYRLAKVAGGYLDFEDLLLAARELLTRSTGVRRSVQRRIRYLLVDELQDSALIERDIILLVVRDEAALRRSKTVRVVPGKLFVVGDDKQSIYRFRGAEVSVFNTFTAEMERAGDVVELDVSFRTVPRGVAFANDFFGALMGREAKRTGYESRYFDLTARRREDADFLEVMIPAPVEGELADDARAREARMIASRILEMVTGGEKLVWDREQGAFRAVRFGDVAVLFRAMTQSQVYEHGFREAGLPYYIVAGRGFYRLQEVLDLLTMLKVLEHPADAVSLAGTLRSPLFGISDETLYFMSRAGSLREGLDRAEEVADVTDDQRAGLVAAREVLAELSTTKNRVPVSKLLQRILERTGFDATLLAQFMGKQKFANVEKLIDLARSFEAKGLFTLDEFVRTVERFVTDGERESERAAEEESSNVVQVMSVHRAKGMEFPVVFVADCSHDVRRHGSDVVLDRGLGVSIGVEADETEEAGDRPVLYDLIREEDRRRDEAENLRILYVALTRAKDHLVISGWLSARRTLGPDTWLKLLSDQYGLMGDEGIAEELKFGKETFVAPVRTEVPEVSAREARTRRRAGWKVVRRLGRLAARLEETRRAETFEGRKRVEPLALDLGFKRRFVPSEFTEYRYCPERYRLSRIVGVLPTGVWASAGGAPSGGALLGTVVHRVLGAWDFADAMSLESAARRVSGGMAFTQVEDMTALTDEAVAMIARAHAAGLFAEIAASAERRTEYPLAAPVDGFVVDGIIDSVHRLADGSWEIVDYKTDRVSGDEVARTAAHYEPQVASYAVALAKSGREVSRVSLLFLRALERH
ncbi:MAG TPA: UvrD-helicase domain-containing protein, partial [Planctomycetota bacterium]|nr:UvrD-helicase domain-containing protein [Planctomycetota bacterium]